MQPEDLKPAWQRFKLQHTLPPLDTAELVAMLESNPYHTSRTQWITKGVVFLLITLFCVGG